MTEIDLHGFRHEEVKDKLPNLLIIHYNMGNTPIRLITGKSEKMKEIVIPDENDFVLNGIRYDSWNRKPQF